jgi:hypothetical protein
MGDAAWHLDFFERPGKKGIFHILLEAVSGQLRKGAGVSGAVEIVA